MDHRFYSKRIKEVNIGDIIYYEDKVFVIKSGVPVFAGMRINVAQVIGQGYPGHMIIKIMKSAGVNAYPIDAEINKPLANLMRGYDLSNIKSNDTFKSGGHLEGTQQGKKVALTDASKGGMSVGAKHTEGGIKGAIGEEERPIEFEGDEIILTAPVSSNPDKYEFEGKEMTGREIASKLNEDNGGVSFAEGGEVSTCRCSGKSYKFGGQVITDRDIIRYLNFMNKPVNERILALKN